MLISREVDYALRIIRFLKNNETATTTQICQNELIPKQFTYKILKKLENAGFISIKLGSQGGCQLKAKLEEVSLYDVIIAIDKVLWVNACMDPTYKCNWESENNKNCCYHNKLQKVQQDIQTCLKGYFLKDILSAL